MNTEQRIGRTKKNRNKEHGDRLRTAMSRKRRCMESERGTSKNKARIKGKKERGKRQGEGNIRIWRTEE